MKTVLVNMAVAALMFGTPAIASISSGKALTLCKTELKSSYGKDASLRLKRIRRNGKLIQMRVTKDGETFRADCTFDKQQRVTITVPENGKSVAAR